MYRRWSAGRQRSRGLRLSRLSPPSDRPRQRMVLGDDLELPRGELEENRGGVRVGPAVEGTVLFPGVQVHHGVFRLPGRHPAEVGGSDIRSLCAARAPRCSVTWQAAIGAGRLPPSPPVPFPGRGVPPFDPFAAGLQGIAGKAGGGTVEGRGVTAPGTNSARLPLAVLFPVTLLPPGPAGGARGPALGGLSLAAARTFSSFDPFPALALAAEPVRPPARLRRSPPISKTGLPAGMVSRPGRRPEVLATFMAVLPAGGRRPLAASSAEPLRGPPVHLPAIVPPSRFPGLLRTPARPALGLQFPVPRPFLGPSFSGARFTGRAAGHRGNRSAPETQICGPTVGFQLHVTCA